MSEGLALPPACPDLAPGMLVEPHRFKTALLTLTGSPSDWQACRPGSRHHAPTRGVRVQLYQNRTGGQHALTPAMPVQLYENITGGLHTLTSAVSVGLHQSSTGASMH